jgi:hypothetical protein
MPQAIVRELLLTAIIDGGKKVARVEVKRLLQFDNASDREPLVFIACYLLDAHEQALIRML